MPMACSSKGEMLVRQQTRDDSPWMIERSWSTKLRGVSRKNEAHKGRPVR
jgi:hypothetical protein